MRDEMRGRMVVLFMYQVSNVRTVVQAKPLSRGAEYGVVARLD